MMKHVADVIYRNTESGVFIERPWIDGRRTWRSLETENLKLAKVQLPQHRQNMPHQSPRPWFGVAIS